MSKRVRFETDSGTHEIPVIGLDENGETCVVGMTDFFAEIQSHKDEVALDKIVARCTLTGEDLSAPEGSFGDTTIFPKDLLEAKQMEQRLESFTSKLEKTDLDFLYEKGFDEFLKMKVDSIKKEEVKKDE